MRLTVVALLSISVFANSCSSESLHISNVPVVLWHGMGDSCCNPLSMGSIKKLIEEQVPGIYVKSLMLGDNVISDTKNGFFGNANDQVEQACAMIKSDKMLQGGYHAIGFSQGGQFVRALAQRCPSPPIKNLISVGGQQQGIFGLPYCSGDVVLCNAVRKLLDIGAYSFIQNQVIQAQYWHDPLHEDEYKAKSIFLADINNENSINASYKSNLLQVKNFVLIKFTQDNMVVPKDSSWFGFYNPGTLDVIPMENTTLYSKDKIGIRKLNESGRLHFLSIDADHLRITREEFVEQIINKYLK